MTVFEIKPLPPFIAVAKREGALSRSDREPPEPLIRSWGHGCMEEIQGAAFQLLPPCPHLHSSFFSSLSKRSAPRLGRLMGYSRALISSPSGSGWCPATTTCRPISVHFEPPIVLCQIWCFKRQNLVSFAPSLSDNWRPWIP
jgi:hypothetical protein